MMMDVRCAIMYLISRDRDKKKMTRLNRIYAIAYLFALANSAKPKYVVVHAFSSLLKTLFMRPLVLRSFLSPKRGRMLKKLHGLANGRNRRSRNHNTVPQLRRLPPLVMMVTTMMVWKYHVPAVADLHRRSFRLLFHRLP
jgi:hypothetical protein